MIKATANTNVRAVLQHGGGLVHTQQPRAHARGRQLTPRGGAINRRCEATSIIPLPFPSSVAAVYPLTCVRRARTLSPTPRYNNRPHAQLVVGYGLFARRLTVLPYPLMKDVSVVSLNFVEVRPSHSQLQVPALVAFLSKYSNNWRIKAMHFERRFNFQQQPLSIQEEVPPLRVVLRTYKRSNSLMENCSFAYEQLPVVPSIPVPTRSPNEISKELINLKTSTKPHQRLLVISPHRIFHFLFPRETPLLRRHRDSYADSDQRPNCLHPARPIDARPVYSPPTQGRGQHEESQYNQHRRNPGTAEQLPQRESNVYLPIQHNQLQASKSALSLPAFRTTVHGGPDE